MMRLKQVVLRAFLKASQVRVFGFMNSKFKRLMGGSIKRSDVQAGEMIVGDLLQLFLVFVCLLLIYFSL